MKSKEQKVLELFFNLPTKHWHFEEIVKEARIARSKADSWLKKLVKEKIIKKIKIKSRMPYYLGNYESSEYKSRKRLYAWYKLYESGLLNHLYSLKKAKAVILFGSFSRSDWYQNSDIDLFIYGNPQGLKIADYELKLHREIQLFICKNYQELSKLGPGLIRNIIKGSLITGNLDFVKVKVNA